MTKSPLTVALEAKLLYNSRFKRETNRLAMTNTEEIKKRYLQDTLAVRMGNLASNLLHIRTLSRMRKDKLAFVNLIEESQFFIEWTALEYEISITAELIDIQRLLAKWKLKVDAIWDDPVTLNAVGDEAKEISNYLVIKSGLLDQ